MHVYSLLSLFIGYLQHQQAVACFLEPFTRFDVFIHNDLPSSNPPLVLHCKSKVDDLGIHILNVGQVLHFTFAAYPWSLSSLATSFGIISARLLMFSSIKFVVLVYGVILLGVHGR